uniref:Si:dkey-118j18.2 n=1 Tax=Hucho hucho TaxID=62062 RepID=A0A4W5JRM6_9TELE
MELYWYIVVIVFIIIKIFFYVCWYRSRQRQLAAYLNNPRNAQIVIVGGRAYLHQTCERPNTSIWPSWYGVQDEESVGEPSTSLPPAASFSHTDMPPPYEAVSGADDLKPPPYSEFAQSGAMDTSRPSHHALLPPPLSEGGDSASIISEAPPPYTPSPNRHEGPVNSSQSHSDDRPS